MLSPLKPLLCRHDFYWSERHQADRCRGCGKTQAAHRAPAWAEDAEYETLNSAATPFVFELREAVKAPDDGSFLDIPAPVSAKPVIIPVRGPKPSAKVLKAQARERRDALLDALDRLAVGRQLSRQETIDTVLALIEDAHSADPVLFGTAAPTHFATLHEARGTLVL